MPAAKIQSFAGMLPALADVTLPETAASYALNVVLGDGTVRGTRPMVLVKTMLEPTSKRVFRIPADPLAKPTPGFGSSYWKEFAQINTDMLRTPVVNDAYDRYYWAGDGYPKYSPLSRLKSHILNPSSQSHMPYKLGVPVPSRPAIVISGGSANALITTRAYTYTWVTEFGEEGPPAVAAIATGKSDANWRIIAPDPTQLQGTERMLTHIRWYRTVTSGAGVATYFLISQTLINLSILDDTATDASISAHAQLESLNWIPPPVNLSGWVAMPNGSFAGWVGNDVYFSEPYRPHAWPPAYGVSVDSPIIGLGVHGQSLIVLTKGNPHVISGTRPSQMSQAKIPSVEPCLARGSIVSTLDGVLYASQNGLALATAGGVRLVSSQIIDKEAWLKEADPYTLRAVRHGQSYLAFNAPGSTGEGFIIDKPPATFSWLRANEPIVNVITDVWTGETLVIRDGGVYHYDPAVPADASMPFLWRSKIFEMKKLHNFSVAKVRFTIIKPVSLGGTPLAAVGGGNFALAADMYAVFRMWADDKLVFVKELRKPGEVFRLPAGFKALRWQFEIEARVLVDSIEVATSARELATV